MQLTPYRIPFNNGYQIKTISVKDSNAIALTTNGVVFTWGTNSNLVSHCQGVSTYTSSYVPVIVGELYKHKHVISNVYCGERFFIATSLDSYNLLTWGQWCNYQNTPIQRVSGMHLGLSRKIHDVSCTDKSAYCLLTTGVIYYWNNWDSSGNKLPYQIPRQITNIPFIRSLSSGKNHSACIDIHGNLYAWGVITSPNIINQPTTPVLIGKSDANTQYTHVKCGIDSLVVLDSHKCLHFWGKNTCNKLSDSNVAVFHTLTKVDGNHSLDF